MQVKKQEQIRDTKCESPSSMKYNKYNNKYNKVKALNNTYLELDAWTYEEMTAAMK